MRSLIGEKEIYKFLKDTLENSQNILIIIDGLKPEFQEMMNTYTDTWGRFVKVQIVNHFRKGENSVITMEPPFQNIDFEDAISPSPDKEISEPSQYTEELHLQGCSANVKDVYGKLRNTFLSIKSTLRFNPTKNYVGVVDKKRIAYIQPKGKKVYLIVLVGEDEVREILSSDHHDVVSFSESRQYTWGGPNPTCGVNVYDTEHWDEIQELLTRLVEKHPET